MQYHSIPEVQHLTRDIKCLWTLEESAERYNQITIIPDSYLELIVNLGGPLYWINGRGQSIQLPAIFMLGLHDRPLNISSQSQLVQLASIRLHAWALSGFGGYLTRSALSSIFELSGPWRQLPSHLQYTLHRGGYPAVSQEFLAFFIEYYQYSDELTIIRNAGQTLYSHQGQLRIPDLAQHINLSVSQLERRLKQATSVTPKTLARLIRFEQVRNSLFGQIPPNLTYLAHDFGYTDQAHLGREFKALTGYSPTQYLANQCQYRAQLADFLQDS